MSWRAGAVAIVIAACACGDKQPRAQNPRGGGTGSSTPTQVDAGADGPGDRAGQPGSALTEAECTGLVDHVVEIAARRFRADAAEKGKPIPTQAQLQKIRARLQEELGTACLRMQRKDFECAMSAENAAALEACQAAEEPVDN